MSHKLTRAAYQQLIKENLAGLAAQPRTLERAHIIMIVKESERHHYDLPELLERIREEDLALDRAHERGLSLDLADDLRTWIFRLEGSRGD